MRTQNHRAALWSCVAALAGLLLWFGSSGAGRSRGGETALAPQGPSVAGAAHAAAPPAGALEGPDAAPRSTAPSEPPSAPPPPPETGVPPDPHRLRVFVVGELGAPVPHAPGWVRRPDGSVAIWVADAQGEAAVTAPLQGGVPGSALRVGLGPPGAPWPGSATLEAAAQVSPAVTLVAPATGAVEVRVLDAAGNPVPQVTVTTDDGLSARTDWDGRCAFPCLQAGQRRLHASAEGLGRSNHAWRLAPGAKDSVGLVLRAR